MRDRAFRASGDRPADGDVDATLDRARRRAAALADAVGALGAVRGRATSADGLVEVVVDARGALVSLTLADAATRQPAGRIAALVLETAQTAAGAARQHRHAVLDDLTADLGR